MFSRTFKEVAEWYLENMGILGVSWKDQAIKRCAANALIKAFGHRVLSHGHIRKRERLDRMCIREWRAEMMRAGMSHATLIKYLSAGSVFIKTAWRERDWDLPNPFDGMCSGLKPNVRKRTLTQEEQAAMLLALPQPYRDICAFILETAMRDGEVLHLEWDRVEDGYVLFRSGENTSDGGSKSRRNDRAYLTEAAKEIISRQPKGRYVFTKDGKRVAYNALIRAWHTAREKAGVEHCTPHDLRRTVGYNLRDAGVPMDAIQTYLRHSSMATTEKVYAAVNPAKAIEAVKVLNMGLSTRGVRGN